MKQRSVFDKRMIRMFGTFSFMVALLIAIGLLLYVQVNALLDVYMEEQGKKQAETLAEITERQFESELNALYVVASELPYIEGMRGDALRAIQDANTDGRIGVLRIGGAPFYGEVYSMEEFPCIERATHGESAISFCEGKGLMFCVPAFRDENVMFVVYRLYSEDRLFDNFGVTGYGGSGRVRIADLQDRVIVDALEAGSAEPLLFDNPDVAEDFAGLNGVLYAAGSAVTFIKTDAGEMMLYAAEIHNTDYHLTGYVPKSVVRQGVGYIGMLVILVFAVLAGMVFFGGVLLMNLERRVKESEMLRRETQAAEHANAAKSEFLANMSHEIRTPINAVLGMNEMILREGMHGGEVYAGTPGAEPFERIAGYAHNVDSAGKNLLAIINDILDFSKIESGKMELVQAPYKLSSVLNDVCNMVIFRAQEKNLSFSAEVENTIPDELYGDEVRVRQIITNLMNNAVKYTKEGSITLQVRAEREKAPDAGAVSPPAAVTLLVSVADTGIGIKEEDIDKLFTKFGRVDLEANKSIEGTGLGLAITGSLLQMMGGSIDVKSEYGKGSVFTAIIPQTVLKETPIGSFREKADSAFREQQAYRESFHAPEARILVVDDTEINLTVFKGLITETQVKVNTALSGAQALEMTKDIPFDLIYMDQRMPGMDGTQSLHAIRAQTDGVNAQTPVICLTADVVQGARERYLSEGFTDYLSKPVEGRALEQSLVKYLPAEKVSFVAAKEAKQTSAAGAVKQGPGAAETSKVSALYQKNGALSYEEARRLLATDGLIENTLRQFHAESAYKADELEQMLAAEDYANYTIRVHALKSSARMIGATALSEAAAHLEELGNLVRE